MMLEVSAVTPTTQTRRRAPVAAPDQRAPGSYGRVAAWLSKRVEVALAEMDLTLPQYRVLGILAEGSSAASGLAQRASVQRPSITALVDGLVARGLVERSPNTDDRRRIALGLTNEGARVIAEADRSIDDYLGSIAACLPDKEEAMALRSLQLWGEALANFHQTRHDASEGSASQ
jgi:long-chain acyl-CoA synthetase